MQFPRRKTRTRYWPVALVLTLLLHAGILGGVGTYDWSAAVPSPEVERVPVEVIFAPEPEAQPDVPSSFTELPPDRADEAPERADFLSNVDSRARDEATGGTDPLPRMDGRSEAEHVPMEEGLPKQAHDEQTPPPVPDAAGISLREPIHPHEDPTPHPPGTSDLPQEAMASPESNADLPGGISLNTTAWEYAPWLQRFTRELYEHWEAPLGNQLGLIHGWTLLRIEIAPDGRLVRLEVAGEEGIEAFRHASVDAIESMAPFEPLPNDFPEPLLILSLKLIYPERPRIRETMRRPVW